MQIHELNTFGGVPGELDFLAIDSGFDTAKISAARFLETKVNRPRDEYNQFTDGDPGQLLRTNGDGTTEWVDQGLPTDEQTAQAVRAWLDDHPEATTTVQDGSLTEAKFSAQLKLSAIKDYVTPEMFGAVGDGATDDTDAIKAAIAGGSVIVLINDYAISDDIEIPSDRIILGNDHTVQRKSDGGVSESVFLITNAHNVIVKDLYIDANFDYTNRITDEANYNTYRANAKSCLEITNGSYDVYIDHVRSSYGLTGFSIGSASYNVTIVNSSCINTLADGVHMGYCWNCAVINHYCEGCQDDAFSCNTYTDSSYQPHDNIYDCCRALNCYGRGFNTSGLRIKFSNGICLHGNMVPVNFETRVETPAEDCEVSDSFFTTVNEQSSSTLNTKKKLLLTSSTSASKKAKKCRINNSVLRSEQPNTTPNILYVEGESVYFKNVTIENYVLYSVGNLNIYDSCNFNIFGGLFSNSGYAEVHIKDSRIETKQSSKADSEYCCTLANGTYRLKGNEYINGYTNPFIRFGGSTADPVTLSADTSSLSLASGGANSAEIDSDTFISKSLADSSNTVLKNGQLVLDENNNVAYMFIGSLKQISN